MGDRLFPALLKYWRHRRGLSQLDLALAAEVSPRHLSFLETARAQPSREMVLRLLSTLEVPLREQNEALEAAGFAAHFAAPALTEVPAAVAQAIARMMAQQEPYPLTVLSPDYDVLRANAAAERVFARLIAAPEAAGARPNILSSMFDPHLARPFVVDWPQVARRIVARLHREHLRRPSDTLARVLAYPGVPKSWRQPDFAEPLEPTLVVRFARDGWVLSFLTTLTVFSSPQQVTLEELRVESYFPVDEETAARCAAWAGDEATTRAG